MSSNVITALAMVIAVATSALAQDYDYGVGAGDVYGAGLGGVPVAGVGIGGYPAGIAGPAVPYLGGYYPAWAGRSSSNALGGGAIGSGSIWSDNTAFTNGGSGFARGMTNAQGFGANIYSAASSRSVGGKRRK